MFGCSPIWSLFAKKKQVTGAAVHLLAAVVRCRANLLNLAIMNIGIIGAGHIGSALAVRLVSFGHSV